MIKEDKSHPVVSLQYWVGTGSMNEGHWQGSGLSHLLEHLVFKGTCLLYTSWFFHRVPERELFPYEGIPDAAGDCEARVKREWLLAGREIGGENRLVKQIIDLALLTNGMLKGKNLTDFIQRSISLIEK